MTFPVTYFYCFMNKKILFTISCFYKFLILFILLSSQNCLAQKYNQDKPLRVFIIGNSFSQNATKYLPQLAKEGGYKLQLGRAELGGCSLQRHWEIAVAAEKNPNDVKGKAYKGKSLRQLLSYGSWDIITLQQYSLLSADSSSYEPYLTNLYHYVKSIQPNAKVALHQTWAYRTDVVNMGFVKDLQKAVSDEEMYQKLTANYQHFAAKFGTDLIPTGDAFWQISLNPLYKYVKDKSDGDLVYPKIPLQKNSLHVGYKWGEDKKLAMDSHGNAAGCYLGALVWYRYLFNANLSKVKFRPEEVSEDFAQQLKKAATTAIKKSPINSLY